MPEYRCPSVQRAIVHRPEIDEVRSGDVIDLFGSPRLVRAVVREDGGRIRLVYIEAMRRDALRPPYSALARDLVARGWGGILERGQPIPIDAVQYAIESQCDSLFTRAEVQNA